MDSMRTDDAEVWLVMIYSCVSENDTRDDSKLGAESDRECCTGQTMNV